MQPDTAASAHPAPSVTASTMAELLAQRGAAFVLATGYGANSVSKSFPGVPILQKPFRQNDLERAVREALNVV
jgi:hypothetical protein